MYDVVGPLNTVMRTSRQLLKEPDSPIHTRMSKSPDLARRFTNKRPSKASPSVLLCYRLAKDFRCHQ